jgi:hypothetical protein
MLQRIYETHGAEQSWKATCSLYSASLTVLFKITFVVCSLAFNNTKRGEKHKYTSPNATPRKKERKLINSEEKLDVIILPGKGECISNLHFSWFDQESSK